MKQKDIITAMQDWTPIDTYANARRFKQYQKRYPRELASCLRNLADLVLLLRAAGSPLSVGAGFFRSEGRNVWRIGQTGVPAAHETRLYVYIHVSSHGLYVLTVGDKNTQRGDIAEAYKTARRIENEL